jgi:sulfoxide reductase heme-binding subunit YedZ
MRWLEVVTHLVSLSPLALLIWDYTQGQLTADPIREITLRTGRYALIWLILSLACTPVYIVFGLRQATKLRRPLGLYAFVYASLHLLAFVGLDYGFNLTLIADEILQKRFVQVGLAAFVILLSLAVTSTRGWARRLGKGWKILHRLVYLAALLAMVHFVWVVKADLRRPLLYGAVVVILLIVRIPGLRKAFRDMRRRLSGKRDP